MVDYVNVRFDLRYVRLWPEDIHGQLLAFCLKMKQINVNLIWTLEFITANFFLGFLAEQRSEGAEKTSSSSFFLTNTLKYQNQVHRIIEW